MLYNFLVGVTVFTLFFLDRGVIASTAPECKNFEDVFRDGRELCENIYGDSFEYIPRSSFLEYELAYTMWFFSENNPNDATTTKRLLALKHSPFYANTGVCHLRSPGITAHKEVPTAENSSTFTECAPYRSNACCHEQTVENVETIKGLYGGRQRWDTCGSLSPQCERFFVQESCFYECDPNAGLFRRFPPTMTSRPADFQEWEIYKLPIKGDYCDAWFSACRQDAICSEGNIFKCGGHSTSETDPDPLPTNTSGSLSPGAIAGIVIASVLLFGTCLGLGFVLYRERVGRPLVGGVILEGRPIEGPHNFSSQAVMPTRRAGEGGDYYKERRNDFVI